LHTLPCVYDLALVYTLLHTICVLVSINLLTLFSASVAMSTKSKKSLIMWHTPFPLIEGSRLFSECSVLDSVYLTFYLPMHLGVSCSGCSLAIWASTANGSCSLSSIRKYCLAMLHIEWPTCSNCTTSWEIYATISANCLVVSAMN
jgi:hypothetical protein